MGYDTVGKERKEWDEQIRKTSFPLCFFMY